MTGTHLTPHPFLLHIILKVTILNTLKCSKTLDISFCKNRKLILKSVSIRYKNFYFCFYFFPFLIFLLQFLILLLLFLVFLFLLLVLIFLIPFLMFLFLFLIFLFLFFLSIFFLLFLLQFMIFLFLFLIFLFTVHVLSLLLLFCPQSFMQNFLIKFLGCIQAELRNYIQNAGIKKITAPSFQKKIFNVLSMHFIYLHQNYHTKEFKLTKSYHVIFNMTVYSCVKVISPLSYVYFDLLSKFIIYSIINQHILLPYLPCINIVEGLIYCAELCHLKYRLLTSNTSSILLTLYLTSSSHLHITYQQYTILPITCEQFKYKPLVLEVR